MRKLLIVLLLILPVFAADDVRSLVDRLFSEDASERETARKALMARGDGVLKELLAGIEARQPERAAVRFYDVADLSADESNWKPALARVRTAAKGAPTFELKDNVLVIAGDADLHERVQAELKAVREFYGTLVQLEVRFLKGEPAKGALPRELREEEVGALIERLRAKVTAAPKLTCRNGQRATITALEQVSFIEDVTVEESNGKFVLDPTVGIIQDGIELNVRPVVGTDDVVRLVVSAMISRLQHPFPTLKVPTIAGRDGEIQVPELRTVQVRKLLQCKPGKITVFDLGGGEVALVSASKLMLDD